MNGPDLRDVPCLSCQHGYGSEHGCESPDYCPCDRGVEHVEAERDRVRRERDDAEQRATAALTETLGALDRESAAEARLAALRQAVQALADEWEAEVARGHWCGECFAPDDERNELRAVLAEHATPSDRRCLDCGPGYRIGDDGCRHGATPSDPPQDEPDGRLWDDPDVAEAMGPRCLCGHRHLPAHPETCREALCHCPGLAATHTLAPAPASADTEGVRLTEGEREELRFALAHYVREYDEGSRVYEVVERILAARLRAATEGKGEAR